jgi:hypothetical protein
MANIASEIEKAVKGGVWNDNDIAEPTTWTGETGGPGAIADIQAQHIPLTHEAIRSTQLAAAGVDADVLNAIVQRTQAAILKVGGINHGTIVQLIDAQISATVSTFQSRLDAFSVRVSELENRLKDRSTDEVARLEEKLNTLEQKQDALIGDLTSSGPEEARMIRDAYEIIKNRQAVDEETVSDPSIIERLHQRSRGLEEHLARLEPHVDTALAHVAQLHTSSAKAKKKFGRMI